MLFANRIRKLREEKELRQRQLAALLEIDTPMYSKIERGERPAKREQVILIANFLEVSEEELLSFWLADQILNILKDDKDRTRFVFSIVDNCMEKK